MRVPGLGVPNHTFLFCHHLHICLHPHPHCTSTPISTFSPSPLLLLFPGLLPPIFFSSTQPTARSVTGSIRTDLAYFSDTTEENGTAKLRESFERICRHGTRDSINAEPLCYQPRRSTITNTGNPPTNAVGDAAARPETYAARPATCAARPATCATLPATCAARPTTCAARPATCAARRATCATPPRDLTLVRSHFGSFRSLSVFTHRCSRIRSHFRGFCSLSAFSRAAPAPRSRMRSHFGSFCSLSTFRTPLFSYVYFLIFEDPITGIEVI